MRGRPTSDFVERMQAARIANAPDETLRCLHARTVQFATDQLVTVNLLRSGYLHGLSIE